MIIHKPHKKARSLKILSNMNKVCKYYLYQYDFKTTIWVLHLFRKNKSQTKFILNEFSADFLLKFALLQLFFYYFYEHLAIQH